MEINLARASLTLSETLLLPCKREPIYTGPGYPPSALLAIKWGEALQPSTKLLVYLLVFAFAVSAVAGLGTARIAGVDEESAQEAGGTLEVGCTCHNPEESLQVRAVLEGVPDNYAIDENTTYELTVRITGELVGDSGGFNLHASNGVFTVPEGATGVQVTELGDATHTIDGVAQTSWNVTWAEPAEMEEAVLFRLTVNSVNGNGAPDPDDLWARSYKVAAGSEGAALGAEAHPLHIETLGVNWLAYWVGIVSFAFMIVILILYYFVFRYAETSHATDHRARKKK